ncbi:MAG: hypothetical protein HYY14_05020 [Candidatus Omnitrophica bacterium]|nr:hypothetical protein [Candidatus Omnitrophota bacterium]
MASYVLKILNRDRAYYEGEVASTVLPGGKGSFGVLARHAPLVSTLEAGLCKARDSAGTLHTWRIGPGLVETALNRTTLFLDDPPQLAE